MQGPDAAGCGATAWRTTHIRVLVWTLLAFLLLAATGKRPVIEPMPLSYPCLSYAPFRQAQWRPDQAGLVIPADVIEADLAHLATRTSCVRIYGTANGLDVVPSLAHKLGLRVWLGVWLGSDPALNAAEMQRAEGLLRQYGRAVDEAVIDRVIVGSEVLLRGDLTEAQLQAYLQDMQQKTAVPVTYADVWEFWLQHSKALAPHVDEAMVHILPYWENTPIGLSAAVDHVFEVWMRTQKALAPLPVLVGETGWPAAGRQRGEAKPGVWEQQQFLTGILQRIGSTENGSSLNVIEAFNQPWKAASEGVAGSAWGVLDDERDRSDQPRLLSLSPHVDRWLGGLCALFFLVSVPILLTMRLQRIHTLLPARKRLLSVGLASLWAALLLLMPLTDWSRLDANSPGALLRAGAMIFSFVWMLCEWCLLMQSLKQPDHEKINSESADTKRSNAQPFKNMTNRLREAGLWSVAIYTMMLLHQGRYMDLAWPLLALPALPWALRVWAVGIADGQNRLAFARAGLLAGSSVAIVQVEGWGNGSAVAVSMLVLLMAVTSVKKRSAR